MPAPNPSVDPRQPPAHHLFHLTNLAKRRRRGRRGPATPPVVRGVPRWRRVVRVARRSPLIRGALVLALGLQVRRAYVDLAAQQAGWGRSVVAPIATAAGRAGDVLRADDIGWRRLPAIAVPAGTATRIGELVGTRLASPIAVGEVLSPSRLADAAPSALAARAGDGNVAIAVPSSDAAPIVVAGDTVEVVDAAGGLAVATARVLAVRDDQVVVAVRRDEASRLAVALAGPVTLAIRGAGA